MNRASVVITSYNHKKYLIEAIESIIHQTVKVHEIIIADDHSTDGSSEIMQDYMARFPGWIKGVFQKENVGIPKNRNSGLLKVTGNYVSILDGDDRFLPDNVEKMMERLEEAPEVRCVYSNVRFIDPKGKPIRIRDQVQQPSGDIFYDISIGKFGILRSMFMDYTLLREVGLLDERFPRYDGFDLTVRLAKCCYFAYISQPLTEYRIHPSSDSKALKAIDHLRDLDGIYRKMLPLLEDLPNENREEIKRVWRQMLLRFYVKDTIERGSKSKQFFLFLLSIFRGYSRLRNLPAEMKAINEMLQESSKK